jgi:hypothetical protein
LYYSSMPSDSRIGMPARGRDLVPSEVRAWLRPLLARVRALPLGRDGAVVDTFPRSGTTWVRFLVANALTGESHDFQSLQGVIPPLRQMRARRRALPGMRLASTHQPPTRLAFPDSLKIVYVVRDPHDVAMSNFHLAASIGEASDLDSYVAGYVAHGVHDYGTWSDHARTALRRRSRAPMTTLIVRYEDLKHDTAEELARVLFFLGAETIDSRSLALAVARCAPDRLREKEEAAMASTPLGFLHGERFVRRADSGAGREELPEQARSAIDHAFAPEMREFGYDASDRASPR